jgi:hypothetical protein
VHSFPHRLQAGAADSAQKLGRLVLGLGAIMASCLVSDKSWARKLSYVVDDEGSAPPMLAQTCSRPTPPRTAFLATQVRIVEPLLPKNSTWTASSRHPIEGRALAPRGGHGA